MSRTVKYKPVVAIDMDAAATDFEPHVLTLWQQKHPEIPHVPILERKGWEMKNQWPEEHHERLMAIWNTPGLFRELPPVSGVVAAVHALEEHAHVVFCTAPLHSNATCRDDKAAWVEQHFGPAWVSRVCIMGDKTLMHADILIDDKPRAQITGARKCPSWVHVLFRTYHNESETEGYMLRSWEHWREDLSRIAVGDGMGLDDFIPGLRP